MEGQSRQQKDEKRRKGEAKKRTHKKKHEKKALSQTQVTTQNFELYACQSKIGRKTLQ